MRETLWCDAWQKPGPALRLEQTVHFCDMIGALPTADSASRQKAMALPTKLVTCATTTTMSSWPLPMTTRRPSRTSTVLRPPGRETERLAIASDALMRPSWSSEEIRDRT